MEMSGEVHGPAVLLPGKSPWNPLEKRLGRRSGRGVEESL
jgi:hypothetical protein